MPRFKKNQPVVEAYQWFKNGDHPEDGPADKEGKIVRRFRHPYISGAKKCEHCGVAMSEHGWLDTPGGGQSVCPGDWVVTEADGSYRAYSPSVFEKDYTQIVEIALFEDQSETD